MGSNANALVVAPLHNDTINLVTGNASTYTPSGGFVHAAGKRRHGVHFDLSGTGAGHSVQYPLNLNVEDYACLLMHCVVTPQQDLNSAATTQYHFLEMADGTDLQGIYLAHHDTYNGIELDTREAAATDITLNDFDMLSGVSYSLTVIFQNNATFGTNMSIYLNGLLVRSIEVPEANLPHDIDALWVGNLNNANNARPAKSIMEDLAVLISDTPGAYDGDTAWKLHTQGLNPACVDDPTIYEQQLQITGYKHEETGTGIVPRRWDAAAGRLWGYSTSNRDQLYYSDNEGGSWSLFHDFAGGQVIRAIWIFGDNVYVSFDGSTVRSSKTTASFSEVLPAAGPDSYILNWGVAISPDGTTLAACEYEPNTPTATNGNRVLTTTTGDLGDWTARKALVGNEEHWHSVFFAKNGDLYATVGDSDSRVYRSTDNGANWTTVVDAGGAPLSEEQVIQAVECPDGRILWASDKTTSRALLGVLEPGGLGHPWDGASTQWSRLGAVTGPLLANVFAIHRDGTGLIWIHAHAEGNAGRHSSVWLMRDDGRALLLAEDLREVTWSDVNSYVETPNYIWLDVHRWPKTAAISAPTSQGAADAAAIAAAVRTELATELARIDVATSSRSSHPAPDLSDAAAAKVAAEAVDARLTDARAAKLDRDLASVGDTMAQDMTQATPGASSVGAQLDAAGTGGGGDATEAKQDILLARTAGGVSVSVSGPVAVDGELTLYAGADYSTVDGRAIIATIENYSGPDLTNDFAILRLVTDANYKAGVMTSALELTDGVVTADGSTITITFEAAAVQTATLSALPIQDCNHRYQVLTVTDGRTVERVVGSATVKPIIEGSS